MTSSSTVSDSEKMGDSKVATEGVSDPLLFIEPAEEKRLLRKLDGWIVGLLGLLYLISFLDRSNIGNANAAGMSVDLGLVGNQFGACVSVVYATYVFFEPLYSNLLKIIGPRLLLGGSTVAFGAITIGTAFVTNYHGLLACRILLGWAEAGIFPCITMFIAMSYRREEIARRISFIYVCAAISGAVGGMLAFGLTRITSGSLKGWQYLYIVEGAVSLAFAPIIYYAMPNTLDTAWFLNKRERELCVIRYEINKQNYDPDEKFSWEEPKRAALDWKTWSHGVMQFCANLTLYGITTFMPTIIKGLNLTSSTVMAQLLTVPVYCVAALSFLIGAYISDKTRVRSTLFVVYVCFTLTGYIILLTVKSAAVRYFGVFWISIALYGPTGLNITWTNNNNAGHYRRATASGLAQFVGNSAGAVIGFVFSSTTAPGYHTGIKALIAVDSFLICLVIFHRLMLQRINKKRAEMVAAGAPDQPELGSDNPHFQYLL